MNWRMNNPGEIYWIPSVVTAEKVSKAIIEHDLWYIINHNNGQMNMVAPLDLDGNMKKQGNDFVFAIWANF